MVLPDDPLDAGVIPIGGAQLLHESFVAFAACVAGLAREVALVNLAPAQARGLCLHEDRVFIGGPGRGLAWVGMLGDIGRERLRKGCAKGRREADRKVGCIRGHSMRMLGVRGVGVGIGVMP
jgi:hypothetical protein